MLHIMDQDQSLVFKIFSCIKLVAGVGHKQSRKKAEYFVLSF